MAQDKMLMQINAKLDALLEKAGLKPDDIEAASPRGYGGRVERKLTEAEQQAIDNAPKTPVGANGPVGRGPRVNAMNAPVTPVAEPKSKAKK